MEKQLLSEFQEKHIKVWNEKDRSKRDALMQDIYADDILMYDKDFILKGRIEVSDFIDKVLSDPAFHFSAGQDMDHTQDSARLYWDIQTSNGAIKGMDFFIFHDDKVKHLYVYM